MEEDVQSDGECTAPRDNDIDRSKLSESVARAIDKVIFDAMHEAYNARANSEAQVYSEIRALGFQHPPELFAWVREIFSSMRASIVRAPGADPAAPIMLQLRRGLYPDAPGVCVECRGDAFVNVAAPDPLHSLCHVCAQARGHKPPQSIYEVFNGVPPTDNFTSTVENGIYRRKPTISRDESFLTGTKMGKQKNKTKPKKKK